MKIRRQKRGFYITDEAFLLFQQMAEDAGQPSGAFEEQIIRDLAVQRLSAEQRTEIKRQAEQLASRPAAEVAE
jgi:hypothetical protein